MMTFWSWLGAATGPYVVPVGLAIWGYTERTALAIAAAGLKHDYACKLEEEKSKKKTIEQTYGKHFNHEYDTYVNLWGSLVVWRYTFRNYRIEINAAKDTRDRMEVFKRAGDVFNPLLESLTKAAPFVDNTIYKIFEKVLRTLEAEMHVYFYGTIPNEDSWTWLQERQEELAKAEKLIFGDLIEAIRSRIGFSYNSEINL